MESEQEWQDHFPNAIFFGEVICKGGSAVREETNFILEVIQSGCSEAESIVARNCHESRPVDFVQFYHDALIFNGVARSFKRAYLRRWYSGTHG